MDYDGVKYKNDFPIERGTLFNEAADNLSDIRESYVILTNENKSFKNVQNNLESVIRSLQSKLGKVLNQIIRVKCFKDSLVLGENYSVDEILIQKVVLGAALSDEEKVLVVKSITGKV